MAKVKSALKKLFTLSWFKPLVLVICLSLLIWFAGPYFAFAGYYPLYQASQRLLVVLLLLLIWAVSAFYRYHQEKKKEQQLNQALAGDAQDQADKDAEALELKEKFRQAFTLINKSAGGQQLLSRLPWYMIIGSPGCGKTTLLANSGLEFPLAGQLGEPAVKGVGGTKNCDWWFSREAVLLDTAGRYTSRDSHSELDRAAWEQFLALICKFRQKPINGVLVAMGIDELLTAGPGVLSEQINAARQRVSELNSCFKVKLPVYLLLTKTDLLPGFSEFFESYGYREREQVFGLTFTGTGGVAEFDQAFAALTHSLCRQQWRRMEQERDSGRKKSIYLFSHQVAALKNALKELVTAFCREDDFTRAGIVRGVYFTSGTQHGAPIDNLLANVATSLSLNAKNTLSFPLEARSYFIKNLLQDLVFKEANAFGVFSAYEKRKKRLLTAAFSLAGTMTLLLLAGWYFSYLDNQAMIRQTDRQLLTWLKQYQHTGKQAMAVPQGLQPLNELTDMLASLKAQQGGFLQLGLGQAGALYQAVNESYRRLANVIVLPWVKTLFESQLSRSHVDNGVIFQNLKAYLMLDREQQRDIGFLMEQTASSWQQQKRLSKEQLDSLLGHFQHLLREPGLRVTLDQQVITRAQSKLKQSQLADLYYHQFKQGYLGNSGFMLTMADIAGPQWQEVFAAPRQPEKVLSLFYSREFFEKVDKALLEAFLHDHGRYAWVLGEQEREPDLRRLKTDIIKLYTQDYIKAWQSLLGQLDIDAFTQLSRGISALESASGSHSPFIYLLNTLELNTRLSKPGLLDKTQKLLDKGFSGESRLRRLAEQGAGLGDETLTPKEQVTQAFAAINAVNAEENKLAYQDKLLNALSELFVHLSLLSQQRGQGVLAETKQDHKAVKQLSTFAVRQPMPLKRWLRQISQETENVLWYGASREVARLWQQSYLKQCQKITAQGYPFMPLANQEVLLQDFSALFGQSGLLQRFYDQYLDKLVDNVSIPWRWKGEVPAKLLHSEQALRFFEQANLIRQSYFDLSGDNPFVELEFTPVYLDPRVRRFSLNISGQLVAYQFGPPISKKIAWPGGRGVEHIAMSFTRQDGSEVVHREEGTFGLFRLLASSKVKPLKKNSFQLAFTLDGYQAIYAVASRRRGHPLAIPALSEFVCLERL
ncbi:type VI secretion system membrane subunit TssM [Thalassomonas haliotis]|uniref:Type VI secretion system membrane subunit TssM n=1 Tax=Thalassomonas haliotis TaxID=485448 RepID=A0ABY7V820_9GAMM|nr:type VI secretion system membrane subunit TssM [Thalassomonas haliotis]WDE09501.1 type VI secretion system membrane subunit TssM [Thalassomonas haliotis]